MSVNQRQERYCKILLGHYAVSRSTQEISSIAKAYVVRSMLLGFTIKRNPEDCFSDRFPPS